MVGWACLRMKGRKRRRIREDTTSEEEGGHEGDQEEHHDDDEDFDSLLVEAVEEEERRRRAIVPLTDEQKKRIEENRQAAMLKLEAKREAARTKAVEKVVVVVAGEEEEEVEGESMPTSISNCTSCGAPIIDQMYWDTFKISVCTECKRKEEFKLMSKTNLMERYLVTDKDFKDLPFLLKKNPNPKYGFGSEMKLYVRSQVEEISVVRWGSLEKVQEEIERRNVAKVKKRARAAEKKAMKGGVDHSSSLASHVLMQVGSKAADRRIMAMLKDSEKHVHVFGPDHVYIEESDVWKKTCDSCGFSITYEKL